MQQVAAKSSDIAALPINVEVSSEDTSSAEGKALFADLLNQSKAGNEEPRQRFSNDESDATEVTETSQNYGAEQPNEVGVQPKEKPASDKRELQDSSAAHANDEQSEQLDESSVIASTTAADEQELSEEFANTVKETVVKPHHIETEDAVKQTETYAVTYPERAPVKPAPDSQTAKIDEGSSRTDELIALVEYARQVQHQPSSQKGVDESDVTEVRAVNKELAELVEAFRQGAIKDNRDANATNDGIALTDIDKETVDRLTQKLSDILGVKGPEVDEISRDILEARYTQEPILPGVGTPESSESAGSIDVELAALEVDATLAPINEKTTDELPINEHGVEDEAASLKQLATLINQALSAKSSDDVPEAADVVTAEQQLSVDAEIVKQILTSESSNRADLINTASAKTEQTPVVNATRSADGTELPEASLEQLLGAQSEPVQAATIQRITESVVAAVPNATPQLQEQVKGALSSAVAEISAQIEQGHEPAINLDDVIAQTLVENGVTVTPQITAQIEQQISQSQGFLNLAQQIADARYTLDSNTGADVSVSETTRLQVENQHTQQQTQASEKPAAFQTPEGKQQITEKIRWMVNARQSMAEIRLDPPEMGSMQVRVNVSGEAASVNFVVQSAAARDAIADAMPKLRDMLSEQGIELGEAFVQQQDRQAHDGQDENQGFAGTGNEAFDYEEEDVNVIEQPVTRQLQGGVDAYV